MPKEHLKRLILHEGFDLDPYPDTDGNITGGVGHLFTKDDYSEFNPGWSDKEKESYWIKKLDEDYTRHLSSAVKETSDFEVPLSSEALKVVTELKFNMGVQGFSKETWPKAFKALSQGDYEEASRQLLTNGKGGPSKWLLDVKEERANSIADALRNA